MNAITTTEPQALPVATASPMAMLAMAVERGVDIEVMTKLMALAERHEANNARKAFDQAIATAKASFPTILKSREIKHGDKVISKYEDLSAIAAAIDPVLSANGLSYRFRTTTAPDGLITVTCRITHKDGHSEETSLPGRNDKTGAKNDIQAMGSTLTYLQRYTLKAALGLAASVDDDGQASGKPDIDLISIEEAKAIRNLLSVADASEDDFLRIWKIERLEDLPAARYQGACWLIRQRIDGVQHVG